MQALAIDLAFSFDTYFVCAWTSRLHDRDTDCGSFSIVRLWLRTNLVDPASSHMLVSKIKPCMSQYKLLYGETANGSLKQL